VDSPVKSSPDKKHPAHYVVGTIVVSSGYFMMLFLIDFLMLKP
jgi:hypothetical protein